MKRLAYKVLSIAALACGVSAGQAISLGQDDAPTRQGISASRVTMEPLAGEGVWIDPGLTALKNRSGRVMVTVWFDRQFLGDGRAYRRRAKEFGNWKRSELRIAVMDALKRVSREAYERAAPKLAELQTAGKLANLQQHWIVNGFTAAISLDALDDLAAVPGVKKIFLARRRGAVRRRPLPPPRFYEPPAASRFDPSRYRHPWYSRYLLADKTWSDLGATGKGTLNVVHDFNFVPGPHVVRNLYVNPNEIPGNQKDDDGNGLVDDVHGYNFDADSASLTTIPLPPNRVSLQQLHGTLCAAIICGAGTENSPYEFGIAPEGKVAAVIGSQKLESAIEWAVEQGADTYSMSFSIPGLEEYRSHWRKVMEHGSFCGVYFVSGAGNFAQQVAVPVQMRTPEDIPDVVFAAAGVQRDLSRTLFSSKGPVEWFTEHYRDGRVPKPEVCAFNAGLPVLLPNGRVMEVAANGNSFAGPMFCGAIALMLSADPELLPWDLKEIITSTATDVGPEGVDDETGHGLINCYRAVREVLRRKAIREGRDPSPFAGRVEGDELDVQRVQALGKKKQLIVMRVQPNSQAARVGLRVGDRLVSLAGKPIRSRADLQAARAAAENEAKLVVRRGKQELTLSVTPGPLGIVPAEQFAEPVFQ